MTTCQMSVELGAYVLHALEHEEDEEVRRHVAGCDLCQDEVRELSFTASLLSLLTLADLEQLDTDQGGRPASTVARRRRRPTRRVVLGVAAGLLAAVSVPAAWQAEHRAATAPPTTTLMRATDSATHVSAAVRLTRQKDGTRVHLSLTGAYPQGWCALVARSRDGASDTAATWRADPDGSADVAGTTAIPTTRLSELDVVSDTGRVLVRIPVHQES
jgi:hypothetical protein